MLKIGCKYGCIPNCRWLVGHQPGEARLVGGTPTTFLITVATIWDAPVSIFDYSQ